MAEYKVVWSGPDLRKTVENDDDSDAKTPIVIEIQNGIWDENSIGRHGITLNTNLADLPEVTQQDRKKYGDDCRYNIYEEDFMSKIHDPWSLRKDQVTEVNTEEQLNCVLEEIECAIDEYKLLNPDVKFIPVGTDNERHCHTAQFSIRLSDFHAQGKDFERHVLIQLNASPMTPSTSTVRH